MLSNCTYTTSSIHLLNFAIAVTGGAILWRIPDIDLARWLVDAVPVRGKQEPSIALGRAAKCLLTAALIFCIAKSNCPPLGALAAHAWTLCEALIISCWCFVFQTIWHACG